LLCISGKRKLSVQELGWNKRGANFVAEILQATEIADRRKYENTKMLVTEYVYTSS
jgi:hypothetical protein